MACPMGLGLAQAVRTLDMRNIFLKPRLTATARAAGLLGTAVALLLGVAGCTTPIGADRVPPRAAYRQLDDSALNSGRLSAHSTLVLHRYDLDQPFRKTPEAALLALHEQATDDPRRDVLLALAELNYFHADRLRRSVRPGAPAQAPDYYLTAAIYAYCYLLLERPGLEPPPGPFDRRFRLACDLYNRGLAGGLRTDDEQASLSLTSTIRPLAPGPVLLTTTNANFKWNLEDIAAFMPADDFRVRGLSVRDRQSGLGAPLIVAGKQLDPKRQARRFPATLFLRLEGDLGAWSAGELTGSVELISSFEQDTVEVGGRVVPLENDLTAPLAWGLNDARMWRLGAQQFFSTQERIKSDIYFTQPYAPGRVPVVFVHGTFSSPVWWAEMWNTLRADPELRERCQFWYFIYNSGNPISQSAGTLRAALQAKLGQLDPTGSDPALRRMVLIGHSQGGLLAKLAVTDTGDSLWKRVTGKAGEELELSTPEQLALRTNFVFTALPEVERVVFISTPHRGSFLATGLVRKLSRLFMQLPETAIGAPAALAGLRQEVELPREVRAAVPSSLDGMSPRNPWLLALAELPPADHVTAHSIIALKGRAQPPNGSDGVVRYHSAHVPYVASERIVRSGHSCQGKPPTIEEVRRILIEHVGAAHSTATTEAAR